MQHSDKARIWIFQANRKLSPAEETQISKILEDFSSSWDAHGKKLASHVELRHHRFIIISADEDITQASGCSIDKLSGVIRKIEDEYQLDLFNRFNMAYRDESDIVSCSKEEFAKLVKAGDITADTTVFNNTIGHRGQLSTEWEVPFSKSWHRSYFS